MNIAYLDCSAGIAGDMLVAAMLDAGLSFNTLKRNLAELPVSGYDLQYRTVEKHHLQAQYFNVNHSEQNHHRHYSDIKALIMNTSWPESVKDTALAILKKLGQAEAKVHGIELEQVHFHEVGAIDSIIDICSVALGFNYLEIEALYASPVNVGTGDVHVAHGIMPVPAPATLELSKDIPIFSRYVEKETATPTGMAILAVMAKGFGPMPDMTPVNIGIGAGTRDLPIPNVLRLVIGQEVDHTINLDTGLNRDQIIELEADIDDMNPEWYGHLSDKLLQAGVLDVVMAPIYMKKGRPATHLRVLIKKEELPTISRLILRETTTLGVRYRTVRRLMVKREIITKQTLYGPINFKCAYMRDEQLSCKPEYDDCVRIAKSQNLPLKEIYKQLSSHQTPTDVGIPARAGN